MPSDETEGKSATGAASRGQKSAENSKISHLRFLAQTHRREITVRRRYEWRTFIATLSFFVLAAASSLKHGAPRPTTCDQELFGAIVFAIVTFASCAYLRFMHRANETSKRFAHAAENTIIEILAVPAVINAREQAKNEAKPIWSFVWQVLFIVAFACACASFVVITARLP